MALKKAKKGKAKKKGLPTKGRVETQKKSVSADSLFRWGDDGFQHGQKLDAVAKGRRERFVTRFRLKEGERTPIIFVDDRGCYINEHNEKINGKWGNYFTCPKEISGSCMVCEKTEKNPSYVAYYTIIDPRSFTFNNKKYKNRRILFGAKQAMRTLVERMKQKYQNKGGLAGRVFMVERTSGTNIPACGNLLEDTGKKVDLSKIGVKDATVPYDYKKILAVPTDDEIKALGIGTPLVGSEADVGAVSGAESPEETVTTEDLKDLKDIL